MLKSIFSLNCLGSVGKSMGKVRVNPHVEAVGRPSNSLKSVAGIIAP